MSPREDILGLVRDAIGRSADSPPPSTPEYANAALIPARARGTPSELVRRFIDLATEAESTIDRIATIAELGTAVAGWLADNDLPSNIVAAPDPALDGAGWDDTGLTVRRGAATGEDLVSVTPTFAGIAETGTLMVTATPDNPYTLNFLPDTHIAVLDTGTIVGGYEDAWARLRRNGEKGGDLPRSVTLITGPSRSSDIERIVTIGVHGPRRLHIVLVGKADGEETQ
ncbi:MAG: lactate utilization protein [Rhodospirillaceae bacterium]|nr:lactate utilization protein [Rhodospirillaceae bacterium]